MSLVGFDSLNGEFVTTAPGADLDVNKLRSLVAGGLKIEERVFNAFESMGLKDGDSVSPEICQRLCEAGLVVSIILMPFAKCADYIAARNRSAY